MPSVLITGANGFLGSHLAEYFHRRGWNVKALVHHFPQRQIENVSYHLFELGNEPDSSVLTNSDYLVHCAFLKSTKDNDAFAINKDGTEKFLSSCRKAGVKQSIFISSLSARQNALSVYGKQKYACEKLFNYPGDLVIRPGLIIGKGGLFAQMENYIKRKKIIPLISGGKQSLQIIGVDDLCEAIFLSIQKKLAGIYHLASPEKLTCKEFYTMVCKYSGKKPRFVSIHFGLLYFLLSITETLGIRLPVTRENLLGLKMLSYSDTTADMKEIGVEIKLSVQIISES